MTRKIQAGLFGLLLIVVSGRTLPTQGQALPTHPLTLDEAIDYALAHYPAVRAALEQVESARSGVALARTSYLPQLNPIYQANRATQNQVAGIFLPVVDHPFGRRSGPAVFGNEFLEHPGLARCFPGNLWTSD